MAKYIKKEMADMRQTGVKQVCYRLKSNGTVDLGDLARRIARSSTFAEAEIKGVVLSLIEEVVDRMASGHSVHIDGLGTLMPKIGLREEAESEVLDGEGPKRNARSLHVTGVSFRADKGLVRTLDSKCRLEKGAVSRIRKSKYTEEQRLEKAKAFLREHITGWWGCHGRRRRWSCGNGRGMWRRGLRRRVVMRRRCICFGRWIEGMKR